MTPLLKASLAIFTCSTLSLAANLPRNVQPDNILLCQPAAGCTHKTLFGHDYNVLMTDRFIVLVHISSEGPYLRADISVANNTGAPTNLSPEDFRVETPGAKPRTFLYVPPSQVQNLAPSTPATPNAAVPMNPEIDQIDAAWKKAVQLEAAELEAASPVLQANDNVIQPNQVVSGHVYFERDARNKKPQPVNVVIPIAGTVFEFPYVIKP